MKNVITSNLPSKWSEVPGVKGLVAEGDVRVLKSRVKAKVLIFDSSKNLRHFWKKVLGRSELGKGCLGAVNSMRVEVVDAKTLEYKRTEVDKTYFCIIGLIKDHLTMNIITHEAVHAAFSYDNRFGKKNRFREDFGEDDLDNMGFQEGIAYPTGFIASGIVDLSRKHKLLP